MDEVITLLNDKGMSRCTVSRQNEKFLYGQSRKFLLTADGLRDGTNRDEPKGAGLAALVEAGPGLDDHAAAGGRMHEGNRPVDQGTGEAVRAGG